MFSDTSQPETLPGKRDNVSPCEQNKSACMASRKAFSLTGIKVRRLGLYLYLARIIFASCAFCAKTFSNAIQSSSL
jgi:hypothetical protein